MTAIVPHGAWPSPIDAEMLTRGAPALGQVQTDRGDVYWAEGRPEQGGRIAIVRRGSDGSIADVIPAEHNARTRVHEYGGGAYAVRDGVLVFAEFSDQRLYRTPIGAGPAAPEAITPEPPRPAAERYGDMVFAPDGSRLYAVRETHPEVGEPVNDLVALPADGSGPVETIASGRDFYSSPRVDTTGTRLAWLCWDHPDMPWDGTELWVADVDGHGVAANARWVAGGRGESIFQPEWAPDGSLVFVSDRTGWWNLYRLDGDGARPLAPRDAEFGVPQWQLGMRRYAIAGDGDILCLYERVGREHLAIIDGSGLHDIDPGYTTYRSTIALGLGKVWLVAADPARAAAVVSIDLATGRVDTIRRASEIEIDPAYLSQPEAVEFPTSQGDTAYALYYPPRNGDVEAPPGERPPLLVLSHGGPTTSTTSELSLRVQFWTSRGFAVADVDYRGSSGYGRAYRDRLDGQWGVFDVDDCVNAARFLVDGGLADADRLAIRGGSAGGYTTLCALAFRDVFAAGAGYYAIGDLETLARHTHKFESRYLDGLIGSYPEAADVYRERSPAHHAASISCPVILFQGLEDAVVPPALAEQMVAALDANRVPHAYVAFPGEQHGFRRAENIVRAVRTELAFYGRVFGFVPAGDTEPVPIRHLE